MAMLYDGFPTTIGLQSSPLLQFLEKRVQPPASDLGGPLDTTSMRQTRFRTQAPKKLISSKQIKVTAYYDPIIFSQALTQQGINQAITIRFPDLSGVVWYGWLESITPPEHQEGENPLCEIVFEVSNALGASALGNEIAPAYSAGPLGVVFH